MCPAYPDVVKRARQVAARPLQGDQLTLGITELFGIRAGDGHESFLSENFKIRKCRYVLRGKKAYEKDVEAARVNSGI